MKVLIIIPAYNEALSIEKVILKLKRDIKNLQQQIDYLVVNDCSKDNTKFILQNNDMNFVSLPINLGIGGGVQTGYKYALFNDYDIVIQIDGDGQHDTSYIGSVIQPILDQQADIVIGSRFIDKNGFQSSFSRRIGIRLLSKLIKICCGANIHDVTSGYRAVNRKYINVYANDYPTDYPEPEAIVLASLMGAKIQEVPTIMKERETGKSSISFWRSVYYMIKVSLAIILCRVVNSRGDC